MTVTSTARVPAERIRLQGIVENTADPYEDGPHAGRVSYGFLRSLTDWTSYFFAFRNMTAGTIPPRGSLVTFLPGMAPRGPVANDVTFLSPPAPAAYRMCRDCGRTFEIDACLQAWAAAHGRRRLTRCDDCRAAMRMPVSGN